MALSLDDRLLGEKTDYYCSSSDEEDEDITHKQADLSAVVHDADSSQYTGHCTNVSRRRSIYSLQINKAE